jgi:hypothetical protein
MKGKHNRSLKVAVQGPDFMAHPLYIHTYIQYRVSPEPAFCVWILFRAENDRSTDAAVGMINNKAYNSVISDNAVHEAINYFRKSKILHHNNSSDK